MQLGPIFQSLDYAFSNVINLEVKAEVGEGGEYDQLIDNDDGEEESLGVNSNNTGGGAWEEQREEGIEREQEHRGERDYRECMSVS